MFRDHSSNEDVADKLAKYFIVQLQNNLLANCKMVQCSEKYFKCQDSYCIPETHQCNGQWDCPGGQDEKNCSHRTCPGQFKCHNSSICISRQGICDGELDCTFYKDDEKFCSIPFCPLDCVCLLYSISCRNLSLEHIGELEHLGGHGLKTML